MIILRNHQNSTGNYFGPYSIQPENRHSVDERPLIKGLCIRSPSLGRGGQIKDLLEPVEASLRPMCLASDRPRNRNASCTRSVRRGLQVRVVAQSTKQKVRMRCFPWTSSISLRNTQMHAMVI